MTIVIVALFGLVVGSFLNVCIHRIPRNQSIVAPRSACPSCGRLIAFYDNIPVLSYLVLRGRCRYCRTRISWHYPAVEALNALAWVLVVLVFGLTLTSLLYAAFASAMLALVFIDAYHRILPHGITFGGLVLGLATAPWQEIHRLNAPLTGKILALLGLSVHSPWALAWIDALIGFLFGAGMLLSVAVGYYLIRREEGMGHGDIVLMGFVGAVLGWQRTLLTIFLGSFFGAVVGIVLIRLTENRKYQIPFGTFLGIAAIFALLVGGQLLSWYWNLL